MSKQDGKGEENQRSKLKHAKHYGNATDRSPQQPGDFQEDDWMKYLRDKSVLRGWRRDGTQAGSKAFITAAGSYEDFYGDGPGFSGSVSNHREYQKQSAKQTSNTDTGLEAGASGGVPGAQGKVDGSYGTHADGGTASRLADSQKDHSDQKSRAISRLTWDLRAKMCLLSIRNYDFRYMAIPNFAPSGSLYRVFTVSRTQS
jgi:hypothetical protein